MGDLVTQGYTQDRFTIGLSDLVDKQTILNALPQYAGMIEFRRVPGEPTEPSITVRVGKLA